MGKRLSIGLFVSAMAMAAVGRGCVTPPPPTAESAVASSSKPSGHSSKALTSGEAVASDAPAPATTADGTTTGSAGAQTPGATTTAGSARAQTPDERRAELDKQLDVSLLAFDTKLHKEQQKTAEERDARQATVSVGTAAAGGASGGGGATAGASAGAEADAGAGADAAAAGAASAGTSVERSDSSTRVGAGGASATESGVPQGGRRGETRNSRAGDLKPDKGTGGAASASGNGALATMVPDGNDDDIVARRLRKAAEQETDPELKEKLWKEYVEYKKNTQVR